VSKWAVNGEECPAARKTLYNGAFPGKFLTFSVLVAEVPGREKLLGFLTSVKDLRERVCQINR
jgi:hypothetical protein